MRIRWKGVAIAVAAAILGLLLPVQPATGVTSRMIPLYAWYSESRGDNRTTSHPDFAGKPRDRRGDYLFVRIEGYVFDPARPRPQGTVPLYGWYHEERKDYFTTADPEWSGRVGDERHGYELQRIEGFVYARRMLGTVALTTWWSLDRADNYSTTHPAWSFSGGGHHDYVRFGEAGYLPPADDPGTPNLAQMFGLGTLTSKNMDPRAVGFPILGRRDLLVIMLSYSDLPITKSPAYYNDLFFGTGRSVVKLFDENSYGKFSFRKAAIVRTMYPGTNADAEAAGNPAIFARALRRVNRKFDFSRYDDNRDGRVTTDELSVVLMGADRPNVGGAQMSGTSPGTLPLDGKNVEVLVSGVAENGSLTVIAHELTHELGADHFYGSTNLSFGMSLMGASKGAGDHAAFHIDPYTKIRFGWVRPRVIARTQMGTCDSLFAANSLPPLGYRPTIIYDPTGRGNHEYFILEHRIRSSRHSGVFDDAMFDPEGGLAVWLVKTDENHNAIQVPGLIDPGPDGILQTVVHDRDVLIDNDGDGKQEIHSGPDDVMNSVRMPGSNDKYVYDVVNWIIGAPPDVFVPGLRGQSTLWDPSHGRFRMKWLSGADAGIILRAGQARGATSRIDVDILAPGDEPPSRIDEIRGDIAGQGGRFVLHGAFGVDTGTKVVELRRKGESYRAGVVGGSCSSMTVRIPNDIRVGVYNVVVFNDSTLTNPSNPVSVRVVSAKA